MCAFGGIARGEGAFLAGVQPKGVVGIRLRGVRTGLVDGGEVQGERELAGDAAATSLLGASGGDGKKRQI